ncbi:alpha/beta fold hydrolase [Streptomyces sp. NPDC006514]|uniref:alpha/beta fold hydrolase n=1 Tax=Streptomyces sp. NPDC006514 TaxID=3154308 RepID=UPI0033B62B23
MATTTPTDHKVPHVSTVPANAGQHVKLHVREYDGTPSGPNAQRKVVLMLHGRSVPSAVAFDLQHDGGKYSWAQHLAKAGFDVFLMELTGSGLSPRPEMDKPCNANPQHQEILDPNPLTYTCTPPYPHELGNSESEWGEVDAVVEYVKAKKGVTKVALVGQSAAAFVFGPYAIQHPGKVESLLLLAPIYPPAGRASEPPKSFGAPVAPFPVSTPASLFGFPMHLSSRTGLESAWDKEVRSPKQRAAGMVDAVWKELMAVDPVGKAWGGPTAGAPEGVLRFRNSYWWGWNQDTVPIDGVLGDKVPVMIVYGEHDATANSPTFSVPAFYDAVPGVRKLMFRVSCAGHSMVWERQSKVLHRLSEQWLKHGKVDDLEKGSFYVDEDGAYADTL